MTSVLRHNLLPIPGDLEFQSGCFTLADGLRVGLAGVDETRLTLAAERFMRDVRWLTNRSVSPRLSSTDTAHVIVEVAESSEAPPDVPKDESYTLTVSLNGVLLKAPRIYGALHGLQTLLQLVTPASDGYELPAIRVVDQPRFVWRGLLLDAVRHWLPPDVIKRNLDAMAAVKLNVFHWHLTDDQGFRIQSLRFPRLHELGSDGKYYTQEDIRDIVEYAGNRGIEIVPEFDMPGHATSWFAGHPELASTPGPYEVSRLYGGHKATMDPTTDETVSFVVELLEEMVALFPGRFVHLGGDEVDPEHWQSNEAIAAYMRERELSGPRDLLVAFHSRLHRALRDNGRVSIGWDPLLMADGLEPQVVIQSVRGQQWVAEAIRRGHRAIASSDYYLSSLRPTSYHYTRDPFDGDVSDATDEQRGHILGGEASMWTEYASAENVDSRTWPRAAAVAERLWSSADVRDVDDMYRRVAAASRRLEAAGVKHRTGREHSLRDLAGGARSVFVDRLADLVETIPLNERRDLLAQNTTETQLNRLVDAAVPDPEIRRTFMSMVESFVADPSQVAVHARLESDLQTWADNHGGLMKHVSNAPLLAEVVPVSKALSEVAGVGLRCLRALHSAEPLTQEDRDALGTVVESASGPIGEVTLAIMPGIRALLEAAPCA